MKHGIALSVLCSALLLAGCGDDSSSTTHETQYESYIQDALARDTKIKFTLQGSNASVPVPSFALMNASDGTLEIPTGGNDALTNPIAAMGTMDGWSTSMPLIMNFEGTGLADGIVTSGVYLIELSDSMTGSPTPKTILTNGTHFTVYSSAQTDTLSIVMKSDLNPSSEYILAITEAVSDENGDPVGTSSSYAALKSSKKIYTEGSLATVQKVTQGVEALFQATGVDSTKIIYSTWFTTQSVGDTLFAVKGATASALPAAIANQNLDIGQVWKGSANPNNIDLSSAYTMVMNSPSTYTDALNADTNFTTYFDSSGVIKTLLNSNFGASGVYVSKGTVQLPYYLEKGTTWNSQPFESAMPSLALISQALSNDTEKTTIASQLIAAGIDTSVLASSTTEQLKLVGMELTKSDGSALDPNRYITRYNPIPKIKSLESVNILLFTPSNTAADWPVVIYQHGITSAKENAYFFAANLAANGIAVLAIDLPLHGSRSLDSTRSANVDVTAYLNLSNLAVARDNVRQSELDIMSLTFALNYSREIKESLKNSMLESTDAIANPPRFLGHSLGGVVGLPAVAAANRTLDGGMADAVYAYSSLSTANSGGQIANLLLGSEAFGPLIKHNIASSTSLDYRNFAALQCVSLSDEQCYNLFDSLATADQKVTVNAGFSQFAYAAQTLLDTVDPFTNASFINSSLPTYALQVNGDSTVPNMVANAPFAGSEPLATKLGLTTINSSNSGSITNTKDFINFSSVGVHSTFIFPQDTGGSDTAMHTEMISEIVDFMTDNSLAGISNTAVLE
ncbi:alpha/beta fold hydrolase [Vibrio aestuarianus]|uniref:Alpha/beta fold hydrolase n=1 Tax=Vibrio aestuarianus TaxID=28171 RepID=A0AAX3UAT2_9VIBR|nr:VolA/Pla-1 family phospholipase [Vibrio aestuarianus]WGK83689.1 alpha/beta fold hydrolase [Vibrio aestuarianus]